MKKALSLDAGVCFIRQVGKRALGFCLKKMAFRLFLNKQKSGSLVRMKKAFSLSVGVLLYVKVRKNLFVNYS